MLRLNNLLILHGTVKFGQKSIMMNHLSGVRRNVSNLVLDKGFVNGEWVTAGSRKTFEVFNPATEQVVGHCADMDKEDTRKAIDAAFSTFHTKEWQNSTAKERSGLLKV